MRNQGYAYRSILGQQHRGQTLLAHLASVYAHSTLQEWQQSLDNGEVLLEGVRARGDELLKAGQTLIWNRPPWDEPDAPQHFDVLFEDEHLLAVYKPSGLPTLPGAGYMENTLLRLVQRRCASANPVHRLGRATSGIVLFAKTTQVAATLTAQWNTPKIEKIYRALAEHVAACDSYDIRTPIGLVPHPRIGLVWAASATGKPSRSLATVLERGGAQTIFDVSLGSGRPHQIRIHLASIGHPLTGDPLYDASGSPLAELPGLPGDGGYLLHARLLRLEHPVSGAAMCIEAPVPDGIALDGTV